MDLRINRAHARLARRPGPVSTDPVSEALICAGFGYAETATSSESLTGKGFVYVEPEYQDYPLSKRLEKVLAAWSDESKPFKVGTYRIPGLKRPTRKG